MNYLAHIYLSANQPMRMIGNFIADHVKGKMILEFNDEIREGIYLHRLIDEFTDSHPVAESGKARLRPQFHKYAPVILDVYFDHFLARDWLQYHHQPLKDFTQETYQFLQSKSELLPERTRMMLDFMSRQDWLYNYRLTEGIHRALSGMARRTSFESGMERATQFLEENYKDFESEFNIFFSELRGFVASVHP